MSRSERLLALMQLFRVAKAPVSAERLAQELEVSVRTIYRDIATLQQQGAEITGSPGVGYRLQPGFLMPPLMFTEEEIEALVLGSRWVAAHTDTHLAAAARNAIARISAVLPTTLRENLEAMTLFVPAIGEQPEPDRVLRAMREAIRTQVKARIEYADAEGAITTRTIWPISVGFFQQSRVVVGWCELRVDFRHFRTDRIRRVELTTESLPRDKADLLRDWRRQLGVPPPSMELPRRS